MKRQKKKEKKIEKPPTPANLFWHFAFFLIWSILVFYLLPIRTVRTHFSSLCFSNWVRITSQTLPQKKAMFFIRVHSVDADHPLAFEILEFTTVPTTTNTTPITTTTKKAQSKPNSGSKFSERRGITHLFRSISHSSLPNPSSRSTLLFVIAVPNYFSFEDFIRFCGSRIDHITELVFIRWEFWERIIFCLMGFVCWLKSSIGFWRKLREMENWVVFGLRRYAFC